MSDDCFSRVIACRDEFVRVAAERLLSQPLIPVRGLAPSKIPTKPGVYMLYEKGKDRPFHVGESKNLQQRIYQNQLRGQMKQSPLKRKVCKKTSLTGTALRDYIFEHFLIQFMPLPLGRIEVEDYLKAEFGIVESRPHAKRKK